jgi:Sulfotransferase domain
MTSQMRLLPDFLIIGGQRCGTTSLYFYLTELPGIARALNKEVHFYDDHFKEGLGWYRAQFPYSFLKYYIKSVRKEHFITGESSPYYLFHPLISSRLAEVTPHAKLIVLLRNPIDRAYSHHWLVTEEGHETLPFEEAIKREEERLAGETEKLLADENYESFNHRHFSYLARGIYVDQLKRWMQCFPREQFLILQSEQFYKNTAAVLKQTLDFLGIPGGTLFTDNKEFKQYREPNKKGYQNIQKPPKLDPKVREYLVEYFRPHNARLYELLGQDFGWDK